MSAEQFASIARSWIGTPWLPNGGLKGAGVSCQMLAAAIYKEAGLLPNRVNIPSGPMDWSVAHKSSVIEPFITHDLQEWFSLLDEQEWPKPMDMVSFTIGGCGHHLGVVVAENPTSFIHILAQRSVIESRLDDASWLKRLNLRWRPANNQPTG